MAVRFGARVVILVRDRAHRSVARSRLAVNVRYRKALSFIRVPPLRKKKVSQVYVFLTAPLIITVATTQINMLLLATTKSLIKSRLLPITNRSYV
uniref:Uncharacterized protein n=1 Tax=Panagrellus redivivus TaxID=6233 RepID=A0A7E4VM83_PANRE